MEKKCTCCGCKELAPISGQDLLCFGMDTYLALNFKAFVCTKCGHIEFFAPANGALMSAGLQNIKAQCEREEKLKNIEFELKPVLQDLEYYQNKLNALEAKAKEIETRLGDDSITVRENKELKVELEGIIHNIGEAKQKIKELENIIEIKRQSVDKKDPIV